MDLDMTAIIIAMGVAILLLTIGVSVVIGYLVRAYIHDVTPQYTPVSYTHLTLPTKRIV